MEEEKKILGIKKGKKFTPILDVDLDELFGDDEPEVTEDYL